jgi:hypothetical protein
VATQEVFDPYRKWLGIPESELPPSLYRLLGLVDFESDPDVISHAADRCMAHVRTFQSGARAELSQRVLNELAQARNCLLDPQRRQAYDLALRRQRLAAPPAVAPMAMPISPMAPVAVASQPGMAYPIAGSPMMGVPVAGSATGLLDAPDLSSSRRASSVSSRVRRKSSPVPMLLAMFAVVVGLGIGLIVWLSQRNATASIERQPAPATPQVTPKTYVIKRPRADGDATGEVLTPLGDRPDGEGRTKRPSGGTPVVDVRSSNEMRERGERAEPTTVAEAIEEARLSMSRGNPFRAKRMLEMAATLSPTEEQRQRIANLSQMQEYLHAFHVALAAGAEKLEPGRNFLIDLGTRQVPVTFVEFERQNGRRLVFESEGKRMTHRIDSLPADWAMPIARPMLDAKSPASRLAIATFLAMAFNGDRDLARQMWESLITEGVADPKLARELDLPLSDKIVRSVAAPTETKPPGEEKMPPKEAPSGELLPVPSGVDLAEAKRKFRDDYRDKVSKARSAADKAALAGELVAKAAEITDNENSDKGAYRYVLQQEAIELLVDQGNATEFAKLIDALATEYEVDVLAAKAEAFGKASAAASSAEQGEALYLATAEVFSTAKELKRYDVAERLARVAAKCAERAQDRDAAEYALLEAGKMQALHQLVSAAIAGQEKLKSDKGDSAAKTAVGRWECFLNNNWEAGLPLLEKGSDATLSELAKGDLANPKEATVQADLANRWLQYGKSQRDGSKAGPLSRAKHWYEQALGQANDDAKPALAKSLAEVEALLEAEG